jgi:hypothetical protein
MGYVIFVHVQSVCQRHLTGKNGEKYGANWRADGARQTTRLAGRKEDVGTRALLPSPA